MRPCLQVVLVFAVLASTSSTVAAQGSPAAIAPSAATAPVAADLLADINQVERKITALAQVIPADKYGWRPAPGVRSVGEVLMHVAADNYLLPAGVGHPADPSTGIKLEDYATVQAYENRKLDRDPTNAELARSFDHLKRSMVATTTTRMGEKVKMFGQEMTVQQTWIMTATHLHEHLGQLIVYARANGITPPWSR